MKKNTQSSRGFKRIKILSVLGASLLIGSVAYAHYYNTSGQLKTAAEDAQALYTQEQMAGVVRLHHSSDHKTSLTKIKDGVIDLYIPAALSLHVDMEKYADRVSIYYGTDTFKSAQFILELAKGEKMPDIVLTSQDKMKQPLLIINDEIQKDILFSKVDKHNIRSISITKGNSIKKQYGAQGENGVINIMTQ